MTPLPHGVPGARSGAWLRRQRLVLRLTQQELGEALGLSRVAIAKREAGTVRVADAEVDQVEALRLALVKVKRKTD